MNHSVLAFLDGVELANGSIALPTKGGWIRTSKIAFDALADEIVLAELPLPRLLEIWMEEVRPEPMPAGWSPDSPGFFPTVHT